MISAWAGAVTHRLWDDVTHDGPAGTSLGFAVLGRPVVPGIPWWVALHTASTLIGFVGWVWATVHIGRRAARTVLGVGCGDDDAGRRRLRAAPGRTYPDRLLRTVAVHVRGRVGADRGCRERREGRRRMGAWARLGADPLSAVDLERQRGQ
ncbi:DUF4184 family protein [Streptomyces sp. NPDC002730]|uniref:DUF4184 family protein n=1 Tax=Streptomyces sp. NPDC002730 TaxID=3364662 RepID=UPI00369FEF4F